MATQDVQVLVQSLREIQMELQKAQSVSQQFTQQQHENEMVLKELEEAGEDAKIFKKIGPALIAQDYLEATTNVKKRLELIQSEEKRLQEKMQGLSKKGMEIQAKLQQQQAAVRCLQGVQSLHFFGLFVVRYNISMVDRNMNNMVVVSHVREGGVNAWYFSSDSQSPSQDPVVSRLVFKSRLLFIGSMLIIVGWMMVYLIDGKDLLGEDNVYNALSINSFKVLQQAGF